VKHRHLEIAPGTPADGLPSAAIVDLLERGDLRDWRPLLAAIARAPDGELAARVLRLVDAYPAYGTSPLWRSWIHHRRDIAGGCRAARAATRPVSLASIRRRLGLTQVEVGARMGISQSDLSKLERRGDMRISTLASYAKALGVELHVVLASAAVGEARVRVRARRPPDG